jgi:hypothetical protein
MEALMDSPSLEAKGEVIIFGVVNYIILESIKDKVVALGHSFETYWYFEEFE